MMYITRIRTTRLGGPSLPRTVLNTNEPRGRDRSGDRSRPPGFGFPLVSVHGLTAVLFRHMEGD